MTIEELHTRVQESQLKGKDLTLSITYNEFKDIESELSIYYPNFETKIGDLVILKIPI